MILSGKEIERRLGGDIKIAPFKKSQVNPNSYNIRLHDELMVYDTELAVEERWWADTEYTKKVITDCLDMKNDNPTKAIKIPEDGFVLDPGTIYLGRTMEHTETHNLVPMLEGRSSVGRLGISIHATAGFGDAGFKGYWTLEISCIEPVRIYAGVEIGQIFFHTIEGEAVEYQTGKYQNNEGIQASMLYKEF